MIHVYILGKTMENITMNYAKQQGSYEEKLVITCRERAPFARKGCFIANGDT